MSAVCPLHEFNAIKAAHKGNLPVVGIFGRRSRTRVIGQSCVAVIEIMFSLAAFSVEREAMVECALVWLVDAFDALLAAAVAGWNMARAASLATVTGETGLLDPASGYSHGPSLGLVVVVGARKAQALAV